ncbi:MAG: hypothetical protein ACOZFS_00835 [Thermodesulfobacteriota bacterium]
MSRALLIFFLSVCLWEFFTPSNQLGKPAILIGLELGFWTIIDAAESLVLAAVFEYQRLPSLLRHTVIKLAGAAADFSYHNIVSF